MPKRAETNADFELRLVSMLEGAGYSVVQEARIGDAQPDFLVTKPDGHQILIEAKVWPPSQDNIGRAVHLVKRLRQLSKVKNVLVVIPKLRPSAPRLGVVSDTDILRVVEGITGKAPATMLKKWQDYSTKPLVFAAMPFAPKYDDTFEVAMKPAALAHNMTCDRIDHDGGAGDIVGQIKELIDRSVAVFADLSESRPNVLFEAGYAVAKGKPVIQLNSSELSQLPFDVRNNRTVPYDFGRTTKLRSDLTKELHKIVAS